MSKLTREDFYDIRRINARPEIPITAKDLERLELERHTNAYLAAGGVISRFGNTLMKPKSVAAPSQNTQKFDKMFKGTLGITQAARYKGISHAFLARCIKNEMGPKFRLVDNTQRFITSDLDIWQVPK